LREAIDLFDRAANRDLPVASLNLGWVYEQELSVQNFALALQHYTRAAKQGNAVAMNQLGIMYLDGKGVATNRNAAISWFRASAALGNDVALGNLMALGEEPKTPSELSSAPSRAPTQLTQSRELPVTTSGQTNNAGNAAQETLETLAKILGAIAIGALLILGPSAGSVPTYSLPPTYIKQPPAQVSTPPRNVTYTRIGNFVYGSNGVNYNVIGDFLYGTDGTRCTKIGDIINCSR
jgi:hypothetical protein